MPTIPQPVGEVNACGGTENCLKCGAPMPPFFWGENGGMSVCNSCGFKHPCCDT